jgi:type I restriction enzyme S subunit
MVMECKVTTRKSHYPKDVPFEVPEGWALSTVIDVFQINPKNHEDDATEAGFVPMTKISDGFEDRFSFELKPWKSIKTGFTHFRNGDIAVAKISPCLENRKSFVVRGLPQEIGAGTTELFIFRSGQIIPEYGLLFFKSEFFISNCVGTFNGVVGQQRVARNTIEEMPFPIPPIREQKRIIQRVGSIFRMVSEVENSQTALKDSIEKSKARILDMAIHGKLVPQDPSEEPAIALLKRINPDFKASDNLHYEGILPSGWTLCCLEDVLDYEQPQAYIVNSTDYSDDYKTPVLTPGKSFVLGYTNELSGICNHLPVIIFDDFTTESKYVDFPFKVKSSAMKILRARGEINLKYVAIFMSITRLVGDTHKRYWISEYSKIPIPIPPLREQGRIVLAAKYLLNQLDNLIACISDN